MHRLPRLVASLCLLASIAFALHGPSGFRSAAATTDPTAVASPSDEVDLGFALPEGIEASSGISGNVGEVEQAEALFTLERLTLPAGFEGELAPLPGHTAYLVVGGTLTLVDDLGLEASFSAREGVALPPETVVALRNDEENPAVVLRLTIIPLDSEATPSAQATPVSAGSGVESEPLIEGEAQLAAGSDSVLFIAVTTWEPGADLGMHTSSGPVGLFVESGEISVERNTGLAAALTEGRAIVFPADLERQERNDADEPAEVIMAGLISEQGMTVELPTATPPPTATAEPTDTPAPTATDEPTLVPTPVPTKEPTATPTPSPTPPPAGTVLYEADDESGFGDWTLSGGWQDFDGMLVNDGSGGSAVAPFTPNGLSDYAIEAQILVVRDSINNFSIFLRDGEVAAEFYFYQCCHHDINFNGGSIASEHYRFSYGDWHTYRLEVEGNVARFLLDGETIVATTDNRLITGAGGTVGVNSGEGDQINVRSFKVIALGDEQASAQNAELASEQQAASSGGDLGSNAPPYDSADGTGDASIIPVDATAAPVGSLESSRSGIAVMLPDPAEVPAGLVIVEDRKRELDEVVRNYAQPDQARLLFQGWDWRGNVVRWYLPPSGTSPPPNSISAIYVSIHRFGSASAAADALNYSCDDQLIIETSEEITIDPLGDFSRAIYDVSPDGYGATILVQRDTALIRVSTASESGDPLADAIAITQTTLAK